MNTFSLTFTKYGNFGRNYDRTISANGANLEAAICAAEAELGDAWFYRGCTGSYPL